MIPAQIVYITIPLGLTGVFLYMRDMIRGTARPNRVSFLLWSISPFIGTAIAFHQGAGIGILPVFLAGLNPFLIFIFSFIKKGGYWKLGVLDYVCGALALIALVFWLLIDVPVLAIVFAVLSDALASIPTLAKAWKEPQSEPSSLYSIGIITNTIGILVMSRLSFISAAFGFYLVFINIFIVAIIKGRRYAKKAICDLSEQKIEKKPII
jgi:hypothetical protein